MKDGKDLPYRPCAGMMLANGEGKIFVGKRIDSPENDQWQMPQGGVEKGEEPREAAIRELEEETGIRPDLVTIIAETKEELFYDLPDELVGKIWGGKYRGQRQYWYLMRFLGGDADIDINTAHPEYSDWKWVDPEELPGLIVAFKKRLYEHVLREFRELI